MLISRYSRFFYIVKLIYYYDSIIGIERSLFLFTLGRSHMQANVDKEAERNNVLKFLSSKVPISGLITEERLINQEIFNNNMNHIKKVLIEINFNFLLRTDFYYAIITTEKFISNIN